MKSVMISIQPKWCELIANGKKTVEVRKTKPKIDVPFKCYIYCTQGKEILAISKYNDKLAFLWKKTDVDKYNADMVRNGKVIGEFVCDRIQSYECEFVDDDCYEEIASVFVDEDGDETGFIEWSNDSEFSYESIDLCRDSCIEYNELKKYMGVGFSTFYGWHISNLVIYDKPKELNEFRKYISFFDGESIEELEAAGINNIRLKRPPQSWCYVDHPTEKGGGEE